MSTWVYTVDPCGCVRMAWNKEFVPAGAAAEKRKGFEFHELPVEEMRAKRLQCGSHAVRDAFRAGVDRGVRMAASKLGVAAPTKKSEESK